MFSLKKNYINLKAVPCIHLTPDFPISSQDKAILQHLTFDIRTYSNIKNNFDENMETVNAFLDTLSKKDKLILFEMYRDIKFIQQNSKLSELDNVSISSMEDGQFKIFSDTILEILDEIDKRIDSAFTQGNLIEKIRQFILSYSTFPNLKNLGNRPQDTKLTTFYRDDYVEITTLAVTCKLLYPVFGEVISWFTTSKNLDKSLKEITAVRLTKTIVKKHFAQIQIKLEAYITKMMQRYNRDIDDINSVLKGFDRYKLNLYIYSTILTKKLVNTNLSSNNQNIVSYIYKCILDTTRSQLNSLKKKRTIKERFTEKLSADDGEAELLEYETGSAVYKISTMVLIKTAINQLIEKMIIKHNLDRAVLDEMTKFYHNHAYKPSVIAEIILSSFLGKYLYNGTAIKYLTITEVSTLIAILQLIIMKKYPTHVPLLHVLSMKKTKEYKETKDSIDYSILTKKGVCDAYLQLQENIDIYFRKSQLPYLTGKMISELVYQKYLFCTYSEIWKILKVEDLNELQLTYPANILELVFEFISLIELEF